MPFTRKNKKYRSILDILTEEELEYYANNNVAFIEDVIFGERAVANGGKLSLTPQQIEIADQIQNGEWDLTSVAAGRGIGKTAFLAWIIIWWLTVFAEPKIVAIAPSFPQLQSVLWPEINKWLKRSAVRECFVWGKKRIYLRDDPSNSFAEPRTATKEEAMQGLHEDNLLILIDEASGVSDAIWDVVQGSLTNDNNKVVLMSNPTRISGFFYDTHHGEKSLWNTLTFSSEDSPVVDKKYIKMMQFKYVHGTQIHDLYKMHVQGIFPSGDPDAFFTLDTVHRMAGNTQTIPKGQCVIACDVARKGDDETAVAARQGYYFFSAQELGLIKDGEPSLYTNGKTTVPEAIQMVIDTVIAIRKLTKNKDIIEVRVDDTGVGGGVTDGLELLAYKYNLEIIPCLFGGSGEDYPFDADEATHMWATLSESSEFVRLPYDRALMDELVARRWFPDAKGKRKLESKRDFKKSFNGSPDRADAVVMCMADAARVKLMSESFRHSKSNIELFEGYELMAKGEGYLGVFVSPLGVVTMVGVSQYGDRTGIFFHKEGTANELIQNISQFTRQNRIVGSSEMFGTGDTLGLEFMKQGIPIMQAYNYNEQNAIQKLDKLMEGCDLAMAKECGELLRQLTTWERNTSKRSLFESHGGCYALLLVLSEIATKSEVSQLTGYVF